MNNQMNSQVNNQVNNRMPSRNRGGHVRQENQRNRRNHRHRGGQGNFNWNSLWAPWGNNYYGGNGYYGGEGGYGWNDYYDRDRSFCEYPGNYNHPYCAPSRSVIYGDYYTYTPF